MEILKDAHKRGRRNGETEGDKERRRGSWGGVFGGGHKRGVKRLNGGNCNGSRGFWAVFGWRSFFYFFFVSMFLQNICFWMNLNFLHSISFHVLNVAIWFLVVYLPMPRCYAATLCHGDVWPWDYRWLLLENIELDCSIHKPLDCFLTSILETLAALWWLWWDHTPSRQMENMHKKRQKHGNLTGKPIGTRRDRSTLT